MCADEMHLPNTSPEGLQELFTDFDSWTVKFKKTTERTSISTEKITMEQTISLKKQIKSNNGSINQTALNIPLQDLYVQGLLKINHPNIGNNQNVDVFDDYFLDFVTFKLTNGHQCFRFIKSKL